MPKRCAACLRTTRQLRAAGTEIVLENCRECVIAWEESPEKARVSAVEVTEYRRFVKSRRRRFA